MGKIIGSICILLLLSGCSDNNNKSLETTQQSKEEQKLQEPDKTVVKKDSSLPTNIAGHEVPEDFKFKGDFKDAWTWYDLNGRNILIFSVKEQSQKDKELEEEITTRELFARHYVVKANQTKPELLWELYDLEKDCIFDLTADFLFAPQFTDLDDDGIKESTLVYKLACRSDVSPAKMKIVMHENKDKYALRGIMYIPMNPQEDTTDYNGWEPDLSKLKVKEDSYVGYWGRYENAHDFSSAPPAFLEYAKQLWLDNFVEKF